MEYGTSSEDTNDDNKDPWDDPEDPNAAQLDHEEDYTGSRDKNDDDTDLLNSEGNVIPLIG